MDETRRTLDPSQTLGEAQLLWLARHGANPALKYDGPGTHAGGSRKQRSPIAVFFPTAGLSPRLAKKSRPSTRETPAEAELDLHGQTIDQAIASVDEFLDMARRYKISPVRIIHGMGPAKGATLRTEVRRFLKAKCAHKIEQMVIEPHNDGAVLVYIRLKA